MTKKAEQAQDKPKSERLSTTDFLKIYRDHLKDDKTREDLLKHMNQLFESKKFEDKDLDMLIDRAFVFVAKQKYPNLLPPLKKVILASEDDKTSLDSLAIFKNKE